MNKQGRLLIKVYKIYPSRKHIGDSYRKEKQNTNHVMWIIWSPQTRRAFKNYIIRMPKTYSIKPNISVSICVHKSYNFQICRYTNTEEGWFFYQNIIFPAVFYLWFSQNITDVRNPAARRLYISTHTSLGGRDRRCFGFHLPAAISTHTSLAGRD